MFVRSCSACPVLAFLSWFLSLVVYAYIDAQTRKETGSVKVRARKTRSVKIFARKTRSAAARKRKGKRKKFKAQKRERRGSAREREDLKKRVPSQVHLRSFRECDNISCCRSRQDCTCCTLELTLSAMGILNLLSGRACRLRSARTRE